MIHSLLRAQYVYLLRAFIVITALPAVKIAIRMPANGPPTMQPATNPITAATAGIRHPELALDVSALALGLAVTVELVDGLAPLVAFFA